MSKLIYVIFVNTGEIGACLDAIRVLASPQAKRFSHVTMKGPYPEALGPEELAHDNRLVESNGLLLNGCDNFFNEGQNTVFFTCQVDDWIRKIWDKVDYAQSRINPHVTVYDGEDLKFATKIFEILSRYTYAVSCGEKELKQLEIGNGKNGLLLNTIRIDDLPKDILSPRFPSGVDEMSADERLGYIDKICSYLHAASTSGVTSPEKKA